MLWGDALRKKWHGAGPVVLTLTVCNDNCTKGGNRWSARSTIEIYLQQSLIGAKHDSVIGAKHDYIKQGRDCQMLQGDIMRGAQIHKHL